MHSNVEILSAVVAKWLQPLVATIAASKIDKIPFLANIESKIKSTGWVRSDWSITSELSPFMPSMAQTFIEPALRNAMGNIADDQIPAFAFGLVDTAIENGSLEILDGNVKFDRDDLQHLRRLLELNLPLPAKPYQVKED